MEFKAVDRRTEGKSLIEQARLAEVYLLDVFVELCEKFNLRYFLCYGTLIGAFRHNGFIPWDDDIDVCMPTEDYKRFLRLAPKELPAHLLVEHQSIFPTTHISWAKIRDRSSFFCEKTTIAEDPCGFFLDVFPFERMARLPHGLNKIISHICFASMETIGAYRRKRHAGAADLLRSAVMIASWRGIHAAARGMFWAAGLFCDKVWRSTPENDPIAMDGMLDEQVFPLGKHVFEGKEYCVPRDSDMMLRQIFGDWRKEPPEGQRVWHHSILCPTTPPTAEWAMPYKNHGC